MQVLAHGVSVLAAIYLATAGALASPTPEETPPAAAAAPAISTLAVVGFTPGEDLSERDAWAPTAVQETLARRLRRVPSVNVMPTTRAYEARAALRERKDDPPVEWPRVLKVTGAKRWLRGKCSGTPRTLTIELELTTVGGGADSAIRGRVGPGRLMDVLDLATRWSLEQLDAAPLAEATQRLVFAKPARSPSALQYYAKALDAARGGDLRKAGFYVQDALGYDPNYRPAQMMMAKLELGGGGAAVSRGATRLRQGAELAKAVGDSYDEADFQIAQGLVMLAMRSFEPAIRYSQHALKLARDHDDPFASVAALDQLSQCWASSLPPTRRQLTDEEQKRLHEDNLRRAVELQRQVLDLIARMGDVLSEVQAANSLALLYEQLNTPDDALTWHKRAVAAAEKTNSARNEATALSFLGRFYREQKRWPEALDAENKCLSLANAEAAPMVRMTLAETYRGMSSPREALAQYETAYEALSSGTDLAAQLTCLKAVADLRMELGDKQAAISSLSDALDIAVVLKLPEETKLREKLTQWRGNTP